MNAALIEHRPLRERQGGRWEYVFPSRLTCWPACPLKWRFRYLDGIPSPTTPGLFVGKVVRAALAEWYSVNSALGEMSVFSFSYQPV